MPYQSCKNIFANFTELRFSFCTCNFLDYFDINKKTCRIFFRFFFSVRTLRLVTHIFHLTYQILSNKVSSALCSRIYPWFISPVTLSQFFNLPGGLEAQSAPSSLRHRPCLFRGRTNCSPFPSGVNLWSIHGKLTGKTVLREPREKRYNKIILRTELILGYNFAIKR